MTLTNFFTKRLSDDAVFFSVLFRCCAIVCTSCKVWDLGKRHTKYETTGSGLGWGGEGVGGAGGGWRGDNRGGLVPNLGFEPTTCWSVVHHSGRSASITQVHDENTVRVQQTERHLRTLIEPYHYPSPHRPRPPVVYSSFSSRLGLPLPPHFPYGCVSPKSVVHTGFSVVVFCFPMLSGIPNSVRPKSGQKWAWNETNNSGH